MITTINEFKTSKAKKKKYAAYDLIIVDVQKQYKDYISDQFLIDLNTYCNEFNRVFQIYDTNKKNSPDYIFNNQTKAYGKQYGDKLSIDDVPGYFPLNMQDTIKKILTNIPDEGQMFETMYNDYWVYVGAQHDGGHEWFLCNKELANLFKSFAKQQRKIMLVGGAGGECIKDIYVTLKAFGVSVEYNFEHVYSKHDKQKINESYTNNFKIYTADEFYKYISTNGPDGEFDPRFLLKNDGGKKAFKYYQYSDYQQNKDSVFFMSLMVDNIIVALAHIQKSSYQENTYWLSYLCVDPIYEGKGYATQLTDNIFQWFKDNNMTFETSRYTEDGYIKLKPLFNRLASKYNVSFIDKEKF